MSSRTEAVARAVLGAALLVPACGCGRDEGPKAHPVRGKVVVKNGEVQKLAGGVVRLQSVADPKLIGVGEIQEDGSFGIGAFVDGKPLSGLPEGEYRARVEPRGADTQEGDTPVPKKGDPLPKYLKYETSGLKYTINSGENTITVEVEVRR